MESAGGHPRRKNSHSSLVAAIFACAIAPMAFGSTISQIEASGPGTGMTLDSNAVITYIASQGSGYTVNGRTYNSWAFLANDGTGSMEIYGTMPGGYVPTVGDIINASGQYTLYNSIPEFENLTNITKVSSGNSVPGPTITTIPQLTALETAPNYGLSEYLLTLQDVNLSGAFSANANTNANLVATDSNGKTLTVYQWATSYSGAGALANTTIPSGYVDITGIADVYSGGPTTEFIPFAVSPSVGPPPPPPNNSTLFISPQSNQNADISVTNSKNATATVGALVNLGSDGLNGDAAPNMQRVALKGGTATATIQLGASSNVQTDTTTYVPTAVAPNPAHGGQIGTNSPIPAGQTDTATVGYNGADTSQPGGNFTNGNNPGTLQFVNQNNSSDGPVTVTMNPVRILESRYLDAGASTSGVPGASVLVGATGSDSVALKTVNTDTTDTTSNALTTVTLLANSTSAPYTQTDPFTGDDVATLQATAPAVDQVFGGPSQGATGAFNNVGTSTAPLPGTTPLSGNVTLSITPIVSGTYGDGQARTVGGTSKTYSAVYTNFKGSDEGVVGMGLPGENESIEVYAFYTGFQPALVTGNTSPVVPGGTVTLTNAPTDDNNVTVNGSTAIFGLRDSAWVTGISFTQDGWSQNGFTADPTNQGNGTVVPGSQSSYVFGGGGDASAHSVTATLSYDPTQALAGSYTGQSMVVAIENGEVDYVANYGNTIEGATPNDLAPVNVPLANQTGTGDGSGNYHLGGGTFVASGVTHLTGSFTQSGGKSTFSQITGAGALSITGGQLIFARSHSASAVASLAISGNGALDITNNQLTVAGGSLSQITGLIASGFHAGNWDGVGIDSSAADALVSGSTPGTGVGVKQDGTNVVIRYTWYGDLNLDGVVNSDDLNAYGKSSGWAGGDLNYDGVINGDDAALFALGFAESAGRSITQVPEPAAFSLLALPAVALLRRRRA